MKHEREVADKRQNWRLKKTLARRVTIRPIGDDDLKYLWAAYRKGTLETIFPKENMSSGEFRGAFDTIASKFSEGWIIEADTSKGRLPAGAVFGKVDAVLPYMIVAGIVWFPWATNRNVLEGTVSFFNEMRRVMPCMGYAVDEHKRLYEVCCMHGIMRRVGTSRVVVPDRNAALFETRVDK